MKSLNEILINHEKIHSPVIIVYMKKKSYKKPLMINFSMINRKFIDSLREWVSSDIGNIKNQSIQSIIKEYMLNMYNKDSDWIENQIIQCDIIELEYIKKELQNDRI